MGGCVRRGGVGAYSYTRGNVSGYGYGRVTRARLEEGLSLLLHANDVLVRDTTSASHVVEAVGHTTTFLKLSRHCVRLCVG